MLFWFKNADLTKTKEKKLYVSHLRTCRHTFLQTIDEIFSKLTGYLLIYRCFRRRMLVQEKEKKSP